MVVNEMIHSLRKKKGKKGLHITNSKKILQTQYKKIQPNATKMQPFTKSTYSEIVAPEVAPISYPNNKLTNAGNKNLEFRNKSQIN